MFLFQVHPLGLCNTSDDGDLYEYGWVGVVKLIPPDGLNEPCFTLLEKVWQPWNFISHIAMVLGLGIRPAQWFVLAMQAYKREQHMKTQ